MKPLGRLILVGSCLAILFSVVIPPVDAAQFWQDKVVPTVLSNANAVDNEFFVFLKEQADLSAAKWLKTKEEKGQFVVAALQEVANRTKTELVSELTFMGVEFKQFWGANMILVRGGREVLEVPKRMIV